MLNTTPPIFPNPRNYKMTKSASLGNRDVHGSQVVMVPSSKPSHIEYLPCRGIEAVKIPPVGVSSSVFIPRHLCVV